MEIRKIQSNFKTGEDRTVEGYAVVFESPSVDYRAILSMFQHQQLILIKLHQSGLRGHLKFKQYQVNYETIL